MGINRISNITETTNTQKDFSVESEGLDSAQLTESFYYPDFDNWNKYYKTIPEARTLVETLVKWTFGKGFKADEGNIKKLKKIVGNGKETAIRVFKNLDKVAYICGDAFGHEIKDAQGRLTNLKPLNSQNIRIVYNAQGIIIGYEQYNLSTKEAIGERYKPDEIFHICKGRIGDEMGGHSVFEAIENIILARNEVISDLKILFHRFVFPLKVWEADTDNAKEIVTLGVKINSAMANYSNVVIPKGTLELKEIMAVPNQTGGLSPLEYYRELIRVFISACGVPEVIMGWGKDTTEASSKVIYLAWQQTIEDNQFDWEEDIENQLNIKIELEFPQSIVEDLKKDEKKDTKINKEKKSETEAKINTKEEMV
jgi:hypothetical protein